MARTDAQWKRKVEELGLANRRLLRKVQEQQRVQVELREALEFLRRLSAQFLEAEEELRARVARDLREQVAQSCYGARFSLEAELQQGLPAGTADLGSVFRLLNDTAERVQRIGSELRPPVWDDLGVLAALSWACRDYGRLHPEVRVECDFALRESDIPEMVKAPLYRVVEDVLVAATATGDLTAALRVELWRSDEGLQLSVRREVRSPGPASQRWEQGGAGGIPTLGRPGHRVELSGGRLYVERWGATWSALRVCWSGAAACAACLS